MHLGATCLTHMYIVGPRSPYGGSRPRSTASGAISGLDVATADADVRFGSAAGSLGVEAVEAPGQEQNCGSDVCPNAIVSNGSVYVELLTYMGWKDYWQYEQVRGRNTSTAYNTSSGNVSYLQAGGALVRDDDGVDPYSGSIMATTDKTVYWSTYVDTGYTDYKSGWDDYWIMTGHTYFKIWVGYWWEDSTFADYHKNFG